MQNFQNLFGNAKQPVEENPLDNLGKLDKEKPKKNEPDSFNEEELIKMMMTGENSTGTFTPDTEAIVDEEHRDKLHEDTEKKHKVETGVTAKTSDKYKNAIADDMLKNPDNYTIQTPEGEMSVLDAIRKGYNPVTRKFEKSKHEENIEKLKSNLNENDKKRIDDLTNPGNLKLAPADAEVIGLPSNSQMIAKQQAAAPEAVPPKGEEPPKEVAQANAANEKPNNPPDIASLLGGNLPGGIANE